MNWTPSIFLCTIHPLVFFFFFFSFFFLFALWNKEKYDVLHSPTKRGRGGIRHSNNYERKMLKTIHSALNNVEKNFDIYETWLEKFIIVRFFGLTNSRMASLFF